MMKKQQCLDCPFSSKVEVPYSGDLQSDILVVGESPGADEIREKRPFVGASGKLLDKLLSSIGLSRSSVFIANSCRCQIDKEGDSIKDINKALVQCRLYLEKAIQSVKPRLIILLGAYALKQVLNKQKIMQSRGKIVYSDEFKCQVLITVHPAYILRKGVSRDYPNKPYEQMSMHEKLLFSDFQIAKKLFETNFSKPVTNTEDYLKADTLDIAIDCKAISFDLETTGLNPRAKDFQILSAAFSSEEGKSQVFLPHKNKFNKSVVKILANPNISKVVAFRPFDESVLKISMGVEVKGKVHDVLVMAHLVDENYHSYSLEEVSNIYTPLKNIKELSEGFRLNLKNAPEDVLINYNSVDSDATIRCFNSLRKEILKDKALARYYTQFILPAQDLLVDTHLNGCLINKRVLEESQKEATEKLAQLERKCIALIPSTLKTKYADNLKLTRPQLMRDMLFSKEGLNRTPNPQYTTKKTLQPQVGEDHLSELKPHPFITTYLDWKKLFKLQTSYLNNLPEYIREDGYCHPELFIHKNVSGRSACYNPSLHQIPQRHPYAHLIKKCFTVEEGWIMGIRDLAQSEFRIMGWIAGDNNILGAINSGIDLHTKTASVVNRISMDKVTKEMRNSAKGCIAEGQLVLTDKGLRSIESVSLTDLVWDGLEFVKHEGVIYQGEQEVIEYDGLIATPDHEVFTENKGKIPFGKVASSMGKLKLLIGESEGNPIRIIGSSNQANNTEKWALSFFKTSVSLLQKIKNSLLRQLDHQKNEKLSLLWLQIWGRFQGTRFGRSIRCNISKMHKFQLPRLHELWRTWYSMFIQVPQPFYNLGTAKSTSRELQEHAYRQGKQQWPLRGRKLAIGYSSNEQHKQKNQQIYSIQKFASSCKPFMAFIKNRLSKLSIQFKTYDYFGSTWPFSGSDTKKTQKTWRTKVYDILNCGSHHRFVVSGKLVSNCGFGLLYGMSAGGLQKYLKSEYDITYSYEECAKIRQNFFAEPNGYFKLPVFYAYQEHFVTTNGYVRSPLGRKRRLVDVASQDREKRSRAIRQAINFPISSFSSDLGLISFFLFNQEIKSNKKYKDRVKSMLFIHDSIMFRAEEDIFNDAALLLKDCMCNRSKDYIKKHFGLLVSYKIDSDRKQGKNWNDLIEVKD